MIRKKRMGKGIAKILSGLLVFGMVAGLVPAVPGGTVHAKAADVSEPGVATEPHTHCVCGTGELSVEGHERHEEETWIGINNLSEIDNIGDGNYYLKQDVKLEEKWKCEYRVNLCLNGHSITRTNENPDSHPAQNAVIYIDTNAMFTLTDCKENGIIKHEAENTGAGVYNSEGYFIMYNGMISKSSCGVINAGDFNMYGGTISGNTNKNTYRYGGGVYVDTKHIFKMYGGTISQNTAARGGGVYVHKQGEFQMYDGLISGNKADYGGGVYNSNTFNMSGGTITNNTSTTSGGGVYNEAGTFDMSGGTITGNTSNQYGGGVFKASGNFTMSGGEISNNTAATQGGGVSNLNDTFTMSDGTTISGNKAMYGGGVYNTGRFDILGGMITGNQSDKAGGGVFLSSGNTITLKNTAIIIENTVGDNINNNLYLGSNITVQTESLTDKACIGVTTKETPKENSPVTITSDAASAEYFRADNSAYEIGTDAVAGVVLKCKEKLPIVPDPVPNRFTYDEKEHTGIELGENYEVADGTNSATDAGTYEVIIKPSAGKTWEDGTTTEKQLEWIIEKASQNAPTGLVGEKTITAGGSDGKITGVKENMEYRKSGDSSYIACTGKEITGLSAGTYEVRYKGDKNHDESPVFVVTVPDADKPVYILEIIDGTGNGTYVEGTVVTITANPAADGKVFDKWVKMYGDAVIADENSATTTVTTKIAPTQIQATYKDSETIPTPNPEPTPNPNPGPEPTPTPEPAPTPAPNPTPEATTTTPDSASATTTPAASTTVTPAASAPAQVTYDILDGAGSSWTQNTDGSLAIRGSGEISKFREVKVDGVTVDPVNYTVTEGSTIITFKPEYLKSLSAGNHSFELVWTDGTAATNFTVAENADQSAKSPKTGEDFSMALCTVLLMVSCAGLAGIFAKRKRNHAR